MKVAIIILNYNTSEDCRKCIGFLNTQTSVELEIIVVDNCSQKQDAEKLLAFCSERGIVFLQNNENKGYSAGNNIGLRYATERGFEYAMILNPDMELNQADYILKMYDKISTHPIIAVLGTDIVNIENQHQNPTRELSFNEEFFWMYSALKGKMTGHWCDYTISGYCEKLSGCCFMIRMSFVHKIGYFDEHTFLYSEESILAKQVRKEKLQMYYMSDLRAFHKHVKSEKGNILKRMKILNKSRAYYLHQYSGYSKFDLMLLSISKQLQSMTYILLGRK